MGKPKHGTSVDTAVAAGVEKHREWASLGSDKERLLEEFNTALSVQKEKAIKELRQPTLVELAADMGDRLSRVAGGGVRGALHASAQQAAATNSDKGTNTNRRAMVDAFLEKCNQVASFKIIRKHVWQAAGHKQPRQFQYWQAGDHRATLTDDQNFRRILSMNRADFIALLKKKRIASGKR